MSLQSYPVDHIVAVDGKYKGHSGKNPLSDKEVRELFKISQTPFSLYDASNMSEIDKRQIYFDKSSVLKLDCIIVMDSDEFLIPHRTNWPLFMDDLEKKIKDNAHTYRQAYCIPVMLGDKGTQKMPAGYTENLPRLFYKPYDLQYVDDHYTIRNKKNGVSMTFEGNSILKHIMMGHDHSLRNKEYSNARTEYQTNLIKEENVNRQRRQQEFSDNLYKQNHSQSKV